MNRLALFLTALALLFAPALQGAAKLEPAYPHLPDGSEQFSHFPKPLSEYGPASENLIETLKTRAAEEPFNLAATIIFLLAIIHTFLASKFLKLAHKYEHEHDEQLIKRGIKDKLHPDGVPEVSFKATIFHFLGEVEAVFGLWVIALAGVATWFHSWDDFKLYVAEDRNYTEPVFVVVIMAIAASRPVLRFAEAVMAKAAAFGKSTPSAWWFSVLVIAPVLGSFITEPAAMTIGALLLAKKFYRYNPSPKLAYGTLGLLFVNISVGGTLTHFAAPPVLMVAGKWGWDTPFMIEHFGWKAIVGVLISTTVYFLFLKKDLFQLSDAADGSEDGVAHEANWLERETPIPFWVTMVHLLFLGWTVYTAHFPALFVGGFLFFLAFTVATRHHQNPIVLRGPMLVGFFLAGLVIHGGCQGWWISPVITTLNDQMLMLGATVLTAFNDNAAITYLASQVQGISFSAKHAVVAGAVTGGGLTVIANAPNPAGQSILGRFFKDGISPLGLATGALVPTIIVYLCFNFLPNGPAKEHDAEDGHTDPAPIEQTIEPQN
ncbi:MAG: putative Na+/H+ antiporter [Akkermansiaceae bacterium]|nr:putative Na+/H+ antiporter [Akkermansiaceae bacterium]MCP5546894.1 putative Na+/H+ antiporter [Akkermansiaceae bacterium]